MQLPSVLSVVLSLGTIVAAAPEAQYYGKPPPAYGKPAPSCPADKCFSAIKLKPATAKIASAFCTQYITYKPVVKTTVVKTTKTLTTTSKTTVVPDKATNTVTVTLTPTPATVSPTCATTTTAVEGTFTTEVFFTSRGVPPAAPIQKRAAPTIPSILGTGCGSGKPLTSKISSACSCLLGGPKTTTSTSTSTVLTTVTLTSATTDAAMTTTVSVSTLAEPVTACQTATATTTTFPNGAQRTCGFAPAATAYGSGNIVCDRPAPAGQEDTRFRIEGGATEGTIYDGCIITGPENITTPSGGTHLCDGRNNNANPSPDGTLTTCINDAGRQEGFDFDGTWSNSFSDFFINRISQTAQTGNQYWGVLRNLVFTARGGCQEQVAPGDEGLWAFDAFAPNRVFLDLAPQYAVVEPGQAMTLVIRATNPNSGSQSPAQGATILGAAAPADDNGSILITAPTAEGCYQYKAFRTNAIASQTFYLSVVAGLPGASQ